MFKTVKYVTLPFSLDLNIPLIIVNTVDCCICSPFWLLLTKFINFIFSHENVYIIAEGGKDDKN